LKRLAPRSDVAPIRERLPREQLEPFPRREELEALVRYYHHLQNEHKRAALESATRRRIEESLLEVRRRFDRVLEDWVPEKEFRHAWREHLHHRAPEPPGPPSIRPLVFRGVSEAGSVVEVRGTKDEELEVRIDGVLTQRIAGEKDLASTAPSLSFRLNDSEAHETFTASAGALDALADYVDDGKPPPWDFAAELLADGLIDVHFALTPRGRRALASR
jgi:hypothetical protein